MAHAFIASFLKQNSTLKTNKYLNYDVNRRRRYRNNIKNNTYEFS